MAQIFPKIILGQDSISVFRSSLIRQNNFTTGTLQDLMMNKQVGKTKLIIRHFQEALYNQSLETKKLVQANAASQIWIQRRLDKKVQPLIFLESDVFLNSKNGRSQWYVGSALIPLKQLEIIPLLGYSLDVRNGRTDHGPTYASFFSWKPSFRSPTTQVNFTGFSRVKFIAPRRQDNHRFEWNVGTVLPGGVKPWLQAGGSYHELDDYQSRSVQRMLSDTISLHAGINYQLNKKLFTETSQRVAQQHRKFQYKSLIDSLPEFNHTGFRQDELQSLLRISFVGKRISLSALYEYILIDRTYRLENQLQMPSVLFQESFQREAEKNYRSAYQKWNLFSRFIVSRRHSLEAEYSSQYLKYDTPLNSNLDDRDEITYIVRTAWDARWRRNFFMNYELTGQSRYSGYLAGIRSRDNYHQYNLKNRIISEWSFLPGYSIKTVHAVYVTYNVKSFGDPQLTDRSTRFFENQLEGAATWHRRWKSILSFERKVQLQSYLNWIGFSETPLDTTWFTTLQQTNEYTWGGKGQGITLTMAFGYKYFLLKRNLLARFIGGNGLEQILQLQMMNRQAGPLTEFKLRTFKNNQISCRIWWQRQLVWNESYQADEGEYAGFTISKEELEQRQSIFRPYFEVSLSIAF